MDVSTHTKVHFVAVHGANVAGGGSGYRVLPGCPGVLVVVVPVVVVVVVVDVLVALAQPPVGHCHTPFASACQKQFPWHVGSGATGGTVVTRGAPVVLVVLFSGRSLVQLPSLCL